MKPKSFLRFSIVAFAVLAMAPVIGSNSDRLGAYDFTYQASGDAKVRPVQVFDDGRSTYFQFRAGEPVPAIFADGPNGPTFLIPQNEGPYVRVATVASGYSLRLGYGVGRVSYLGGGRSVEATPEPVPTAAPSSLGRLNAAAQMVTASYREPAQQVSTETNSYATPLKGDRVEWREPGQISKDFSIAFPKGQAKLLPASVKALAAVLPPESTTTVFEIVGRDDDTYKEGLPEARAAAIASLLAARGVAREKIKTKSGVPVQTETNSKTVTGVTIRWITEATPVPRALDPANTVVARLMAHRITPQEAINELAALRRLAETPQVRAPEAHAAPVAWTILKSDGTMKAMLERWSASSGWRVQWTDAPEVRITGDSPPLDRPDFLSAADYVIAQAKSVGYRIKASAYSNKVLVLSEEKTK